MRATVALAGACLLLAGLAGCFGGTKETGSVEGGLRLFSGGRIWTADPKNPEASALVVADDTIVFVGSDAEARSRYPTAAETDLGGRRVLPGLIDSHTHFLRVAANWNCDLAKNPLDPKYDNSQLAALEWEQSRLQRMTYHEDTNRSGSTPAHGTTSFNDRAVAERGVACGMKELNAMGLTMTAEAGMLNWAYFDLLRDLEVGGKATVRQSLYIGPSTFDEARRRGASTDFGSDLVRVAGTKYYSDGWLGPRTAALLSPYTDRPWSRGVLFLEQNEADAAVAEAVNLGLKMATHTIGDQGLAVILQAYEKGGVNATMRPAFEHASMVQPRYVPRLKDLGAVLSYQLSFATSDHTFTESAVGKDRAAYTYAWKTLMDAGILLAGGSDFPIETISPFWGLQRVVTRQELDGRPPGGWQPSQRLTMEEALRTVTWNAAYNLFMEDRVGSLEAGKLADFIVLDQDILAIPPHDVAKTCVRETYLAGVLVYSEARHSMCSRVKFTGELPRRDPVVLERLEAMMREDGPLAIM
ncbi:MAG: amidohydrolase family protein [Euryarchaeota archaeon]|nr:amidohydrolase family protein [Euryarchaeota archaeon]